MPLTIVFYLAEQVDFPVRRSPAQGYVAYRFGIELETLFSSLHAGLAGNIRVFIAVLRPFRSLPGK